MLVVEIPPVYKSWRSDHHIARILYPFAREEFSFPHISSDQDCTSGVTSFLVSGSKVTGLFESSSSKRKLKSCVVALTTIFCTRGTYLPVIFSKVGSAIVCSNLAQNPCCSLSLWVHQRHSCAIENAL